MKRFIDHRMLPIAYLTPEGDLLLDDETADYYTTHAFEREEIITLDRWDSELNIFLITGERGGRLPDKQDDPQGSREKLREAIRKAIDAPPLVFKPMGNGHAFVAAVEHDPYAIGFDIRQITRAEDIAAAMEGQFYDENLDEEGRWTGPLMFADMVDDTVELCLPGVVKADNEMAVSIDWWGNNPACQLLCYENNPDNPDQEPAVSVRYDAAGRVVEVSIRDPRTIRLVVEKGFPPLCYHTTSPWQEARDTDPVDPEKSVIA
jgi:hypothetical protein